MPLVQYWKIFITINSYKSNEISGVCPGDKESSPADPTLCNCPLGSIEVFDDKCFFCAENGDVPSIDQTVCVGMLKFVLHNNATSAIVILITN